EGRKTRLCAVARSCARRSGNGSSAVDLLDARTGGATAPSETSRLPFFLWISPARAGEDAQVDVRAIHADTSTRGARAALRRRRRAAAAAAIQCRTDGRDRHRSPRGFG